MRRIATLLLALAGQAHADGLTADQVAAAAATTDPGLASRRADIAAATAAVDQARASYLPHTSVTASYTRLSNISSPGLEIPLASGAQTLSLAFPVIRDQWSLTSRLDVPVSDYVLRLSHNLAAARHSEHASRALADAERRSVVANARLSYYAWARAKLDLTIAADSVRRAEIHLEDVKHLAVADRASAADVLRVESQHASAEQLRVRAENLVRVAETDLRIRLRQPSGELTIGEDLSSDLALEPVTDVDGLAADALLHRPELAALGDSAAALREQAVYQRNSALPRLDIVGDLTTANPNPRYVPPVDEFHQTWAIGAQLTWSPSDTWRQLASARELGARAASADAQRAKLADGVRLEVAQAVAGVDDAIAAQRTTKQGLASADESYRVRLALFREGRATSTELTDAETELTRAFLDAVDARIEARTAQIRFTHATGRDR